MAASQEDDTIMLSQYRTRYPHIPEDVLKDMIDVGASDAQLSKVDNNSKAATDKELAGYKLGNIGFVSIPFDLDVRVAVIGQTGSGKSATANTLYGSYVFAEGSSATAVTLTEQWKRTTFGNSSFTIIDTPGTWTTPQGPKPDMYALVVNLSSPRFDRDDLRKIRKLKAKACILLLTHARSGLNGKALRHYVEEIQGDPLEEFIRRDMDGWRVMAIENSCSTTYEEREQRKNVFDLILKASASAGVSTARTTEQTRLRESGTGDSRVSKEKIVLAVVGISFILIIILVLILVFRD